MGSLKSESLADFNRTATSRVSKQRPPRLNDAVGLCHRLLCSLSLCHKVKVTLTDINNFLCRLSENGLFGDSPFAHCSGSFYEPGFLTGLLLTSHETRGLHSRLFPVTRASIERESRVMGSGH